MADLVVSEFLKELAVSRPNDELSSSVDSDARPFIHTYSTPLDPADASQIRMSLALAVSRIWAEVRDPFIVRFVFGVPPIYAVDVGTGYDLYLADMSQDPIASAGHNMIFLDAKRLARMYQTITRYDHAAVCMLEELVHSWLNIRGEKITKMVTAALYSPRLTVRGERYEWDWSDASS